MDWPLAAAGLEVEECVRRRQRSEAEGHRAAYHRNNCLPPVKRLLTTVLIAVAVLVGSGAMACEKHLNGHQNNSDTNTEGTQK